MTVGLHGAALVRDVVRRAADPDDPMSPIDALERVDPADVELALHPQAVGGRPRVLARGIGASPGVASGVAVFDPVGALDRAADGTAVILVRDATGPADEPALAVVAGVLTSTGGMASHAAILARGHGLPAVCGAGSLQVGPASMTAADGTVTHAGDELTIDGTTGEVLAGAVSVDAGEGLPELDELLGWADEVRAGSMAVWANADTATDASRARRLGAEGIGLCRTEHLFLGPRREVVRRLILTDDPLDRAAALDELAVLHRAELASVLEAMDGLPVTVRLLDIPRHELTDDHDERNPMLGVRGVRLVVLQPEIYRMQVRALVEAVHDRIASGGQPIARVMVPFVSTASELVLAREVVTSVLAEASGLPEIPIGVMVETPRAALRGADLAETADFLSFGTNDLTQAAFALSRDDAGPVVDAYLSGGLLAADPFETIDVDGVGELVATGVERARGVDPSIEIGVCGEHGGDPASIGFFRSLGIDHVSCSPYRVPVARLAAARSVLGRPGASG